MAHIEIQNRPVVLCGTSGSGKDSLLDLLLARFPGRFSKVVSHTTRPPRVGEVDGDAYHFITEAKFDGMLADHDFVENVQVHHNKYGLSHAALSDVMMREKKSPLLILDYHGLEQLVVQGYNPLAIHVRGADSVTMEHRLRERGDSADTIAIRMQTSAREMIYFKHNPAKFQITVYNTGALHDAFDHLCEDAGW